MFFQCRRKATLLHGHKTQFWKFRFCCHDNCVVFKFFITTTIIYSDKSLNNWFINNSVMLEIGKAWYILSLIYNMLPVRDLIITTIGKSNFIFFSLRKLLNLTIDWCHPIFYFIIWVFCPTSRKCVKNLLIILNTLNQWCYK